MPEEKNMEFNEAGGPRLQKGPWKVIIGRYRGYVIMGKGGDRQAYAMLDEIKGPRWYVQVSPLGIMWFKHLDTWKGRPFRVGGWIVPIPQRFASQMRAKEAIWGRSFFTGPELWKENR